MASYSKKREKTSRKRKAVKSATNFKSGTDNSGNRIIISKQRLRLFRVMTAVISPLIFLIALEILLVIFRVGYNPDFMVECTVDGRKGYCNNPYFAWRFFPSKLARQADPFFVPAEKSENTYRIFVLGASAAQGTPDGAFSFSRILEAKLERLYPEKNFEIINTAMVAVNSHVARIIAKRCARMEPDLFIVYLGNNEVVGPYGAGTILSGFSSSLKTIRFVIWFKSTRIGQLISKISEISASNGRQRTWTGMQMFLDRQVRQSDPRMESVYAFYENNLGDICKAVGNKAGVLLCTVGSNMKDCPGFASLHKKGLTPGQLENWQQNYDKGVIYQDQGRYIRALEKFTSAEKIDDEYSDLLFRMAMCCESIGEIEKACDYYRMSRDTDALRFRADTRINEIIRKVALDLEGQNVRLVDVEQALNENQIPNRDMFYEHVHYNFKGNRFLADQCMGAIMEILGKKAESIENDSEDYLARILLYNTWTRYENYKTVLEEFIMKPPFTNQLNNHELTEYYRKKVQYYKKDLKPELMKKLIKEYSEAILKAPDDIWHRIKYAELMEDAGNIHEVARQHEWIVNRFPMFADSRAILGLAQARLDNFDESINQNKIAVKLSPGHTFACYNLALAYQKKQDIKNALKYYIRVIQLDPTHAEAYNNYAGLLYYQGRIEKAIEVYEEGLSNIPGSIELMLNLGVIYRKQYQYSKARNCFEKVLKLDPGNERAENELKSMRF